MNTEQKRKRGRPPGPKPAREVVSFTIEQDLLKRLEALGTSTSRSKSEIMNQALADYLEKERA